MSGWSAPPPTELYDAIDATWAPASVTASNGWTIRDGQGGGKRVSAATQLLPEAKPEDAEDAMSAIGQGSLFMIRDGEDALDRVLADRGYEVIDPVVMLAAPVDRIVHITTEGASAIPAPAPIGIMKDIWRAGGIDAARLDVMARVTDPKTCLLGRKGDHPAATAFVACHKGIAMMHALEVAKAYRRSGLGLTLTAAAARWAQDQGAETMAILTVLANTPAIELYKRMGMEVAGHYHYRIGKH